MSAEALDRAALRALFLSQREPLFRFLYRLCGNPADAEDLLQETFLAVWRKRHQFEGRGAAAGYLRRIAYRVFVNAHQKRERRAALFSLVERDDGEEAPPDERIARSESASFVAARVREAVDSLPGAMRETFVLFRYEGLTCAEIAAATDAPLKTVESRVRRATLLLGEKLRPYRNHVRVS